jgi:hypothetical protein
MPFFKQDDKPAGRSVAKKSGIGAAIGSVGHIIEAIQAIDPQQVMAMFADAVVELKRHNEIQQAIVSRLDRIEAVIGIVPVIEGQLDALENLVRMTVPEANAQLVERDVMMAQIERGQEPVQSGEQGNGFRVIEPDLKHPAFRTFAEAQAHVLAVQNGELMKRAAGG